MVCEEGGGGWPPLRTPTGIVLKEEASQRRLRGREVEQFPYAGFPSLAQVNVLNVIVQKGIETSFSICTEDWVRWCNSTGARVLCPKALQIFLVHSPPPTTHPVLGLSCNGPVYENWNNNQTEQESQIQGIQVYSAWFESP